MGILADHTTKLAYFKVLAVIWHMPSQLVVYLIAS